MSREISLRVGLVEDPEVEFETWIASLLPREEWSFVPDDHYISYFAANILLCLNISMQSEAGGKEELVRLSLSGRSLGGTEKDSVLFWWRVLSDLEEICLLKRTVTSDTEPNSGEFLETRDVGLTSQQVARLQTNGNFLLNPGELKETGVVSDAGITD
jgi:hypothetical protein